MPQGWARPEPSGGAKHGRCCSSSLPAPPATALFPPAWLIPPRRASPSAGGPPKALAYLGDLEGPDHVGGKCGEHLLRVHGLQRGVRADASVVDEQVQALALQTRLHHLHSPADAGQVHCVCWGKKKDRTIPGKITKGLFYKRCLVLAH